MTLTELDTLRADTMTALLNETGRGQVWMYDVVRANVARHDALHSQNYDGIAAGAAAAQAGQPYALIGPGIEDHYFTTADELTGLIQWLCLRGYLSCYARLETS